VEEQTGQRLEPSEIFPMETRAMALAFFYAVGTGIGGVIGGYLIASAVMIAAGVTEWLLGVDAERRSLEDVAKPLTAEEAETKPTAWVSAGSRWRRG
jgi:hypothetical protein